MLLQELMELAKEFSETSDNVLMAKNYDYADQDIDALDNFKKVALIFEALTGIPIKPKGVAFLLKILKLVRYGNLVFKDKEPKNESIFDTEIDDINYTRLGEACRRDEKRTPK